jgi:putative Holliday junction resolvase
MRALGIDWGERRVGVALSDSAGTLATPYETIEHSSDEEFVAAKLREIIGENGVEILVFGLPQNMTGTESPGSSTMRSRAARMSELLGIPAELIDERLTSVSAHQSLRASGLREKKQKGKVDQVAATILLQTWLDSQPQ